MSKWHYAHGPIPSSALILAAIIAASSSAAFLAVASKRTQEDTIYEMTT
jgi:hypothetical protein